MATQPSYYLIPLKKGKTGTPLALPEGTTSIGRESANTFCLPDTSVSRRHAEIVRKGDSIYIQDLNSSNGVHINGVPRKSATLRKGDEVRIGAFHFQLDQRQSRAPSLQKQSRITLSHEAELDQQLDLTIKGEVQLPDNRSERHRDTLYHFCFWLTEGFDKDLLIEKALPLLRKSFAAGEVQFYSADRKLLSFSAESKSKKPAIKFANYLAEIFQQVPESSVQTGANLSVHQRNAGNFNYLVGPVRAPAAEPGDPCPFLVILRPKEWNDFDTQDRVLLQALCQLWARSLERFGEVREIQTENKKLKRKAGNPVTGLLGKSAELDKLRTRAAKIAKTNTSVLIEGETGSGKELVAQFIHDHSKRSDETFVKMNCAAIPEGLIESELFGHVKGAFTDAKSDRRGKFEQADGGTLFLDEIGEMPAKVQAKVLRVLENGEIEKLGAEKTQQVSVRVLAATHRKLGELIERQEFRQDLYYRLSVVSVKVPPLRDHLDDLDELADHFLQQFTEENGMAALQFSKSALKALKKHAWPGNVREFRNVVQRCAIEAEDTEITAQEVQMAL